MMMKLRNKILLAITFTLISIISILYFVSIHILKSNIQEIEQRATEEQVRNLLYLVKYTQKQLYQGVASWSVWDDTYQFINDHNTNYINSNLTPSMLAAVGMDNMLFFNKAGKYVYGIGFEKPVLNLDELPDKLRRQLNPNNKLLRYWQKNEPVIELIQLPKNALLLASYPIFPTEKQGNPNGHLIVGKYLTTDYWYNISTLIQHPLLVYNSTDPNLPDEFQIALHEISTDNPIYTTEISEKLFAGYTVLPDIMGEPALIIRLLTQRTTYQQEQRSLYYMLVLVFIIGFIILLVILFLLEWMVLKQLMCLITDVAGISTTGDLTKRIKLLKIDEFLTLTQQINALLTALEQSQTKIQALNTQLRNENLRMSTELQIARRIQAMVLPENTELSQFADVEITFSAQPATEIGGDYCDIFQQNKKIICSIGDVTGHGLESGVVMLMVQAALKALCIMNNGQLSYDGWNALNQMIWHNIQRMQSDKNLSLLMLTYVAGKLCFIGQHEEVLIIRQNQPLERIDTFEFGFTIGLLNEDISQYLNEYRTTLAVGDGVVLFTDGITEAENEQGEFYGIERLCTLIEQHKQTTATVLQQIILDDVYAHIGNAPVYDDITLIVLKRCH
ncbi:CHASE4 domain-containing protein [Beggiatoa leptomitoformis]|uniref:SpoIIE family protein phosphatase n=1 Tax=Beggiatoa leptomitoformis TaxID=288004 RepID=A0A2N9YFE5_9GAMM|nr:CHASE4 domain-containing protein [Beggiatoa leptomitoformis]AUI69190.2 SpoIIE family protein phosphatase [Beggiatoa leptomitoformis]QGX03749.1 SpoIIE family protein phosphatase [Beggiatoa leptomitoformis]